MSHFEKIRNVTIFNNLTVNPTQWESRPTLYFDPDEIVVRQITYNGALRQDGVYLIWCSVTNDYIGSFSIYEGSGFTSAGVNVTPNTCLQCLPNSTLQGMRFQIHTVNGSNQLVPTNVLTGTIVLNLDFISRKH